MGPFIETFEGFTKGFQALQGTWLSECLLNRGFFEGIVFGEEKTDPGRHIANMLYLGLDDRKRAKQRLLGSVLDPCLFHKNNGKLAESLQAHLQNILAIEPKTFVEVENRISAVDRFQLKKLANFFEGHHL